MGRPAYGTRIDLIKLVAFIAYWEIKEEETGLTMRPATVSELIMTGFEDYVDGLISKYPKIIELVGDFTVEDCLTFMRSRGYRTPERDKYRRSIKRILEDDDLRRDSDTTREAYIAEDHQTKFQLSKEDLEELERIKGNRPTNEQIHEAREGAKEYIPGIEARSSEPIIRSANETEAQAIERIAQKDAKLKKGLDEGPGSSTIIEEKGGDEDEC